MYQTERATYYVKHFGLFYISPTQSNYDSKLRHIYLHTSLIGFKSSFSCIEELIYSELFNTILACFFTYLVKNSTYLSIQRDN